MIITRVSAENVLKYSKLDLGNLPAEGVIAVSGANESGKTSIAETVCFALFGRTVSLPPEEIGKIIRWGESRCTATVEFLARGRAYRVVRHLDDENNQGARLTVVGPDAPLARGTDEVRLAVSKLLGWEFEEFVESFYLPQREATAADSHGAAVKAMAGVAALERVSTVLDTEIRQHTQAIAEVARQVSDVRQQIAALDVRDEALPGFTAARQPILAQQAEHAQQASDLERLATRYEQSVPQVRAAATALAGAEAHTSYRVWREHVTNLERCLAEVPASAWARPEGGTLTGDLDGFVRDAKERLAGLDALWAGAAAHRRRLAALLAEPAAESSGAPGHEGGAAPAEAEDALPRQRARARRRRGWCGAGLVVALALAAAAWTGWVLLSQYPDAPISGTLERWLPPSYQPRLLPAAVVATIFLFFFGSATVVFGARIARLGRRLETGRREADLVDTFDSAPLPEAVAGLQQLGDHELRDAARQFVEGPGAALLDAASLEKQRETLRELVARYEAGVVAACARIAERAGFATREIESQRQRLAEVDRSITEERERRKADQDLRGIVGELERRIADRQRRIAVRTKARELLAGACREISRRFNREVRSFVGRTLPLLTQGRYAHLQIDESLTVRVFSSEKRDFMDLDEISAGTQRQIALAVRLGLSEQLVQNTHSGSQFIFLDEPFALFDQERTRASLEALPRISDEIRQIWITGQRFPNDAAIALHIQCGRESDTLTVARA